MNRASVKPWLFGVLLLLPSMSYPAELFVEDDVRGTWRGTFYEGCQAVALNTCRGILVEAPLSTDPSKYFPFSNARITGGEFNSEMPGNTAETRLCLTDYFTINQVRVNGSGEGGNNVLWYGETGNEVSPHDLIGGRIDLSDTRGVIYGQLDVATSSLTLRNRATGANRVISFVAAGTACTVGALTLGRTTVTEQVLDANGNPLFFATQDLDGDGPLFTGMIMTEAEAIANGYIIDVNALPLTRAVGAPSQEPALNPTRSRMAVWWTDTNGAGGAGILDRIGSEESGPDSVSGEFLSVRR
ncbi:MAG: hypothetical protein HY608_03250 [Planctomycetes bacterium]|nr:hypothetical protein [Planctomycetota bacterium]